MSILVIAAHPDDEVLGCGGSISKFVTQNMDVYIAILGQGLTSRLGNPDNVSQKDLNALHTQSQKAANFLGVKDLFLLNFPDNRFDTVPLLEIVKSIEALIEKIKPITVFTHHCGDLNIDHQITHRATITATRPLSTCPVKELYSYEVPSSTEWAFDSGKTFIPNYFIDITGHLGKKITALKYYKSEIKPFPHPRSETYIKSLAETRGAAVGHTHCEAFLLVRKID